ncbi:hypothetical protein PZH32_11655, partial [Adlercreutzia equolifaciens]|uniref:hypothetical protein n=1 Tax=Adlercreutzia equolifaciens TaxID=446660 RepID=UPI0023B0C078
VKEDLGKWYGRALDNSATDAADPDPSSLTDCYTDGGYKIRVDVRSHIFGNNEDETWYDRLLTAPWDTEAGIDRAEGRAEQAAPAADDGIATASADDETVAAEGDEGDGQDDETAAEVDGEDADKGDN